MKKKIKSNKGDNRPNALIHLSESTLSLFSSDLDKANLDCKKLTIFLLEKADEKEIIRVIEKLKLLEMDFYQEVLDEFKKLEANLARNGIKTKIFEDFTTDYTAVTLSLNIGDQLAYLLGQYNNITKRRKDYLSGIFFYIRKFIVAQISQKVLELKTVIEADNDLTIRNAFHLFFLYKKEKAERLFRKALSDDKYVKRRNSDATRHYYILKDAIFQRVNLDYLPKIEVEPDQLEVIQIANREVSISNAEILQIIDNEDNFNINLPLGNLPPAEFINPYQEIENYKELVKLMNTLFQDKMRELGSPKKENRFKDMGEIFIDNICSKFGNHPKQIFIDTRECIKELLITDETFKLKFFGLLYELKEWGFLTKWNTKFPHLMNIYLGNIKGLSESSIKNFFRNTEKNPVFSSDFDAANFIKKNSNISYLP